LNYEHEKVIQFTSNCSLNADVKFTVENISKNANFEVNLWDTYVAYNCGICQKVFVQVEYNKCNALLCIYSWLEY